MRYDGVHYGRNGDHWYLWWYVGKGRKRKTKGAGKRKDAGGDVNERQVKQLARRMETKMAATPALQRIDKSPRLSAWCEEYAAMRAGNVKPKTKQIIDEAIDKLRSIFESHDELPNDPEIGDITKRMARQWWTVLDGMGYADTTICMWVRAIKTMMNYAAEDEIIAANPFAKLRSNPPKKQKRWHYVSLEDFTRLREACTSIGWETYLSLMRYAGMRPNEARFLLWEDVDFDNARMVVRNRHGSVTTKDNEREVPIFPEMMAVLTKAHEAAVPGETRVCAGVKENNLNRNFRAIVKRAKVAGWAGGYYVFRKNCVSDLKTMYEAATVDQWLGHGKEVSEEHYNKVPDYMFEKAAGQSIAHNRRTKPGAVDEQGAQVDTDKDIGA